jgi:hypothetical protein
MQIIDVQIKTDLRMTRRCIFRLHTRVIARHEAISILYRVAAYRGLLRASQ